MLFNRNPIPFIVLLITLSSFLFSCGEKGEKSLAVISPEPGNILRIDVPVPLGPLGPAEPENRRAGADFAFPLLYSYIAIKDGEGNLKPDLASSWSYDPIRFAWTIHLRNNARFHNGKPVLASDVIFSLREHLKRGRPHLYQLVKSMDQPSDDSIRIDLKEDAPWFLWKICFNVEISPGPGNGDPIPDNHPIGSGPFKFDRREGHEEINLVANEDYYGGKPSLDRIVFHYEPDKEKIWARLLAGETDIGTGINPIDYEMIKMHENLFYFGTRTKTLYAILLYNTRDTLFCSSDVRMALSLGIDKNAIIREVLRNYGKISTGPLVPDSPDHNPDVKPVPYDPAQGVELLKKAGWSYGEDGYLQKEGNRFEFDILYPEKDGLFRQVAEHLKLYLNDMGIRTHLIPLPSDELVRRYYMNTEFQAVITEIFGQDLQSLTSSLWFPQEGEPSAIGCFEDSHVTRTLSEAKREEDPERRKKLFHEAEARIASLQPGTFLFHRINIDVMSKRIELPYPFSMEYSGICSLRFAVVRRQ